MDETSYYFRRAEQELAMAHAASVASAAKVHYTLAGHYLDRAFGECGGGALATDRPSSGLRATIPWR